MKSNFLLFLVLLLISCSDSNKELPVDRIFVISGGNKTITQGLSLDEPIVVKAISDGEGVSGVNIEIEVLEGDGFPNMNTFKTDDDGEVEIQFTAGKAGLNTIVFYLSTDNSIKAQTTIKTSYSYTTPRQGSDGIEVGSLYEMASNPQSIINAIDEIRWGNFDKIHSILVIKNDQLIAEEYFSGYDSQGNFHDFNISFPHEVQSASKSYRSMLIGIGIDQGYIESEQELFFSFFPEHQNKANNGKEKITLHHILTMSGGLKWDEWSGNSLSQMYNMPANKWDDFVLSQPLASSPGLTWVYNTGASILLNQVLMDRLEISFSKFVKDFYADKVQSTSLPGVGNPLGAKTTPRDMAKLGIVYKNGGMWKDTRVISEEWVDKSLTPWYNTSPKVHYGYQWWIREQETPSGTFTSYSAEGNGGQFIIFIRELDLIVVFTGGHFGSNQMFRSQELLRKFIIPAFG